MNQASLRNLLDSSCEDLQIDPDGYWKAMYESWPLVVMVDELHNRIRIMVPICEASELDEGECRFLLEANFDRALDARYALSGGLLWSLFQHSFSDLSPDEFIDSLAKVHALAENYGTTYCSTDIVFCG
ncbi:MAG: hypothetical protein HQL31_08300 [Planctomycetes bacterium]|nr:hypothetical protein [Planctomycetota bacterium]